MHQPSRRDGRRRTLLVVAAGTLLLAGCGLVGRTPQPRPPSSIVIDGLRSDPDGRGLLAGYLGGACDGPARLDVEEVQDIVSVRITVAPDAGLGPGATCSGVGILRTVHADLTRPLAARRVSDGMRALVPFDGSRLLQPRSLPAGLVTREGSGTDESGRTPSWTRTFGPERTRDRQGSLCRPAAGSFMIAVGGPLGRQLPSYVRRTGTVAVPGGKGRLYENGPSVRTLDFARQGTAVSITSAVNCGGEKLLSPQQLAALARSLVPAV